VHGRTDDLGYGIANSPFMYMISTLPYYIF
jgi:hypothetical protein